MGKAARKLNQGQSMLHQEWGIIAHSEHAIAAYCSLLLQVCHMCGVIWLLVSRAMMDTHILAGLLDRPKWLPPAVACSSGKAKNAHAI